MTDPDESAIARGLAEGDQTAWLALYDLYAKRVWRSAARLIGPSKPEVSDVVQETFLAAASSAKSFDPARGTLWVWLWGICRHQAQLHWRKSTRIPTPSDALTHEAQALDRWFNSDASTPQDLLESQELSQLVRHTLLTLPEDYSLLLIAKYMENHSIQEIATDTGLSPSAVTSKLARARQAFRQAANHADFPQALTQTGDSK
jgi:RNA polymerase sigma-70 factor, ECF subfamily